MTNDDNNVLELYQVGKCYPKFKTMFEGGHIEYNPGNGLFLYLVYNKLMDVELNMLIKSSFTMTFESIDDIAFFCFKFGSLYVDVPFYITQNNLELNEIEDGRGYMLSIIVCEQATGEIKGMRVVGLSNGISKEFRRYCLCSNDIAMTHEKYYNIVQGVYRKYTTKQLMDRATCMFKLRL